MYSGPVHTGFVMDRVTLGLVFLRVLRFPPVSISPPILHTHVHRNTVLIGRTSERSVGTFKKSHAPSDFGEHWTEKNTFTLLYSVYISSNARRFRWPRGLRPGCAAARLLGLRV